MTELDEMRSWVPALGKFQMEGHQQAIASYWRYIERLKAMHNPATAPYSANMGAALPNAPENGKG